MALRPRFLSLPLSALLVAGLVAPAGALTDPVTDDLGIEAPAVPGRLVVSWAPGAAPDARHAVRARHGLRTVEVVEALGIEVVSLPARAVDAVMTALSREADVTYAEPDYIVAAETNDPGFGDLWGLHNTGQSGGVADVDVDAPEAWVHSRGQDVVVAVVDTGVDITHPDLADNIWVNVDEIPGNGIDDDGNGYVDDVNGWDFRNGDASVYDSATEDAHGTHVAGTIGAVGDNGIGIVGLAPNVKIMPLKFLGGTDGSGTSTHAAAAIRYAADNGATVINASFGGGGGDTLRNAILAATGAVVVASAGNNSLDVDANPTFPAAWARDSHGMPNVVSVASIDRRGARSDFSNFGALSVDLAAPGSNIHSTVPGGYQAYSGTSMAAPHASGAAALVASLAPAPLTGAQLVAALKAGVRPLPSMAGITTTGGLLNAHAALLPYVTPSPPTDVTAVAANGRATVQWAPGVDGGTPSSYAVTVAPTDGVTGPTTRSVTGGATSIVFDGLTNGVAYAFTVSAANAAGTSAPSAPSAPVTPDVSVPAAPTSVTATAGDGYVDLAWSAPSDDGGTPLTGYTVRVSPDAGVTGELARPVAASATSLRFDGLANGTAYGFTVVATNAQGDGPASTPVTATPQLPPPPPPPSGGGGGGFAPAPVAPAPAPVAPAPAPVAPAPAPAPSEPTEPVALPYDGNGSRSLAWACPVVPASSFADVPASSPHAAGVACASHWQVFTGSTTGAFQPATQLSRGQLASVLARGIEQALGEELPTGRDRFRDDDGSVHRTAIDKLAELGIVGGVSDDRYAPGAPVTRAQFAAMLARTYRELAGQLPAGRDLFRDDDGSSHEAAINALAALGVVAGTGPGAYSPGAVLNRGQAATMVARLLDALVESGAVAAR